MKETIQQLRRIGLMMEGLGFLGGMFVAIACVPDLHIGVYILWWALIRGLVYFAVQRD